MKARFSRGAGSGQSALARRGKLRYASVMAIIASLLLLASVQVIAEPLPAEIHNFHDWVVTCDNGLRCEAVSLAPDKVPTLAGEEPAANQDEINSWDLFGVMKMVREPAAGAPLVITVSDFEGTPAKLLQYGDPLAVRFEPAGDGEWRLVTADQRDFLERLYGEPVVLQDAAGKTLAWFAPTGATGALVYMDERQGRLGTPTSLLRAGMRPASVIPSALALPVIAAAPRTNERPLAIPPTRLAEVRRSLGCLASEMGGEDNADTAALGNGRTLVLMSCGAGAYNYNSVPLIAWREGQEIRIEEARLDVPKSEGVDEKLRYYLTNSEWDPDRRMIHEYAKGRGLGDCGVRSSYVWTGDIFRLAEQEEMSECRGTFEYLTTWRAEVR